MSWAGKIVYNRCEIQVKLAIHLNICGYFFQFLITKVIKFVIKVNCGLTCISPRRGIYMYYENYVGNDPFGEFS